MNKLAMQNGQAHVIRDFVTTLKLFINTKRFDAVEVFFVRISSFCPRFYIRRRALRRLPVSGKIRLRIFT